LVIVNGHPSCGKTTFENACKDYLFVPVKMLSSIDFPKEIYTRLGWDGKKTDKARADLSILKKMWIDNCDGPTQMLIKEALGIDNRHTKVIFTDVRESEEISKLVNAFESIKNAVRCVTVLITRKEVDNIEHGNASDDFNFSAEDYDIVISNDGTANDLVCTAHDFAEKLIKGEIGNEYKDRSQENV
jgi:hypothetical protein